METLTINSKTRIHLMLLLNLAKKLGINVKILTKAEKKDWNLIKKIEKGMNTKNVSRNEVVKALGK